MAPKSLYLQPPLIPPSGATEFRTKNRTVNARLSARSHGLVVFESFNVLPSAPSGKDGAVYFAQWDSVPGSRRKFITDTYIVFEEFRKAVGELRQEDTKKRHYPSAITYCNLYTDILRKHLLQNESRIAALQKSLSIPATPGKASSSSAPALIPTTATHLAERRLLGDLSHDTTVLGIVYTALCLVTILFVPSHGVYNAVVGRELLHWLNSNFLVTMEEEGVSLLKLDNPWLHPIFWMFIKSCTLRLLFRPATHFLGTLASSHSHPATREISSLLVTALNGMPNSEDYTKESDYFDAHRLWKTSLHRLQRAVIKHATATTPTGEPNRYEGKAELEELVALVGGDPRVLVSLCNACGMGWRDAVCVYGIWIQPSMTRANLPSAVAEILEDMPVDPTSAEDQLHAALFARDCVKAARWANDIDVWLVAHMVDMLEVLDLPEGPVLVNLRLYFLLAYGEHLMADPGNWRVAVSYLSNCGDVGKGMANEFLATLPFRISNLEPIDPLRPDLNAANKVPGWTHPKAHMQATAAGVFDPNDGQILDVVPAPTVAPTPVAAVGSTGKGSKGKGKDGKDKQQQQPLPELDDIIEFCREQGLTDAIQGLCRIAAHRLTSIRRYAKAIEYLAKTADAYALNRVVGALANEYLDRGAREFVLLMDKLSAGLMYPQPGTLRANLALEVFTSRLGWIVTFGEFLHNVSQGERDARTVSEFAKTLDVQKALAPKSWWGLILVEFGDFLEKSDVKPLSEDLTMLLVRLEEVCTRSRIGASDEYLTALMRRHGMRNTSEALARLERVRFALVVCAAKTVGGDAGGTGNIVTEKMRWRDEVNRKAEAEAAGMSM